MSEKARINESEVTMNNLAGHNHDGQNSAPLGPGAVTVSSLAPDVLSLINNGGGGSGGNSTTPVETSLNLSPTPDLYITVGTIAPGGSITGSTPWVNTAFVRFTRVLMSIDSECTITFYHKGTYADEDREFRAINCANKFLWEGVWAHYDETSTGNIYYKVTNTGNSTAKFQLELKASTMVANLDTGLVTSIQPGIAGTQMGGDIVLLQGGGVSLAQNTVDNSITISASPATPVPLQRWALRPLVPVTITGSTTITSSSNLQSNRTDYNIYAYFTGYNYVQCDYGAVYNAGAAKFILYHGDSRAYRKIKLEGSADNSTWVTLLSEVAEAQYDGDGVWVHIPAGMQLRYLRLWGNGSTLDTYTHIVKLTLYAISDRF